MRASQSLFTGCTSLWPQVENGAMATQRDCQALEVALASVCGSTLHQSPCPGFRGGWAVEVTADPRPLSTSHSCFLPRLPAGTQPSPLPQQVLACVPC